MYKLTYHPRAVKFLKKLSQKNQLLIINKLEILQKNPLISPLDIKKLSGSLKNSYRLRIRKIRIIYMLDNNKKIIYITDADFRGAIYN